MPNKPGDMNPVVDLIGKGNQPDADAPADLRDFAATVLVPF